MYRHSGAGSLEMLCPSCGKEVGETAALCETCAQMQGFFGTSSTGTDIGPFLPPLESKKEIRASRERSEPRPLTQPRLTEVQPRPSVSFAALLAFCMVVALLCAVLVVLAGRSSRRPSAPSAAQLAPPVEEKVKPKPSAEKPEAVLKGLVRGRSFRPDRVSYSSYTRALTIRQGKGVAAELELLIFLFLDGEPYRGQVIDSNADTSGSVPQLHIKWREAGEDTQRAKSYSSKSDYSIVLRFEEVDQGKIEGSLSLNTKDSPPTRINGSFTAKIED